MPIRFRCVYCNQLLGIGRRKKGTIVTCTNCQGQLIVPDPNDDVVVEDDGLSPSPAAVFEQGDFDAILESSAGSIPAPKPTAAPPGSPAPKSPTNERAQPQPMIPVLESDATSNSVVLSRLKFALALLGTFLLGTAVGWTIRSLI